MSQASPFLIAGGGIGGLATALGLARKGLRSIVLERRPEFGEIGAGIQLGPNAFHAFDQLGVGDAARAAAVFIDHLRLMDATTAEEIVRVPVDAGFRARFGNPYAVIHRGDLYRVLLEACRREPSIELRTDAEVRGYEQNGSGVRVHLSKGSLTGTALIGADGLWSNIRKQVVGDGPPRVSGHTTYRPVVPTEAMPDDLRWNAATLWAGPKCHAVHYPLSGWKLFDLVVTCHDEAREPVAGKPVSQAQVLAGFRHVHPKVRSIIRSAQDWKLWVLCDRDPVERWTDGRVTLSGDAAYPMLQYFAQGACMALEDEVCLAHCVGLDPTRIEDAFAAYRRRRVLRTARVQLQSRWIGENIYHPADAHAQLRNAILRAMGPDGICDSLAWLYGGSGLSEDPAAAAGAVRPLPAP